MIAREPGFEEMRANLVARGLLSPEFALTEAGEAFVDGLIEGLRRTEAESDSSGPRVRWNTGQRRCAA